MGCRCCPEGYFGCTKFAASTCGKSGRGALSIWLLRRASTATAATKLQSAKGHYGFTKSCALALGRYASLSTPFLLRPTRESGGAPRRARTGNGVVRGLVTKEEAATIPDDEVYTRIFGPLKILLQCHLPGKRSRCQHQWAGSGCHRGRISIYALRHPKKHL